MKFVGAVVRFIVSALVLMLLGYFVPGFSHLGFWSALLAAVVIALVGWGLEQAFGRHVSPYGRGVVGFLVSALVIYLAQVVVPGMHVTVLGALIAAFVIGIIDLFIPTAVR
ncbi:MAG: phage holin family protein [Firmicutes bacterium]|nr:phage holin family protein [Alicyclobacillaceae bacterium]MCL6496620.1 phage holin family protein [Bacillota bacterium]